MKAALRILLYPAIAVVAALYDSYGIFAWIVVDGAPGRRPHSIF